MVMKRLALGVISVVMALSASFASWPLNASAAEPQEGFNIITSPLPIKLNTTPGRTVTADLRMKNQGAKPETIKVGLMKFGANGTTGQPDLQDLTPKDTYANWVSFSPGTFVAQPNVWNTIQMTIKVPNDASLGYYLAVTFSRASQAGQKDATNLKGAVATLVLLNVDSPNAKRALEIEDFTTSKGLYEYLPTTFTVKVKNTGNLYLPPTGNIYIQRGDKAIGTVAFNSAGGSVLPDSSRVFKVDWADGFPVFKDRLVDGKPVPGKNAEPKKDLKWDFTQISKFRIGKYTAKLLVVYEDGQRDIPIQSSVSFWVIPWKIILVLLVIVSLIGFGIWVAFRSVVRKAKHTVGKKRDGKKL